MKMWQGRAFALGEQDAPEKSVGMSRQWATLDGRQFLVEEVRFVAIEPRLRALPQSATASLVPSASPDSPLHRVSATRLLPARRWVEVQPLQRMTLAGGPLTGHGVVLDYSLLSSANNFTFKGDTTYVVKGTVNLSGTTTIEAGAVIKFTNHAQANALLNITGPIDCRTAPYHLAVFTGQDDDSVGEVLPWSTGNPTNYYGYGLYVWNNSTLKHLRISHSRTALTIKCGQLDLQNVQFVRSLQALYADRISGDINLNVDNALFDTCTVVLAVDDDSVYFRGRQLTVNKCQQFGSDQESTGSYIWLTNSLLVAVTNMGEIAYTTNSTVILTNDPGVFQTVGAGAHYLANGSAYRDAGTTNLSADLLASLSQQTTFPPTVEPRGTITNDLTFSPQPLRDTNAPDLWYHYEPIDYACGGLYLSNASLSITPGTAVAVFGTNIWSYGVGLSGASRLTCNGTPTGLIHIAQYTTVQEQSTSLWHRTEYAGVTEAFAGATAGFDCRFTDWSVLAQDAPHLVAHNTAPINLQDCAFHGGRLETQLPPLNFTNCLFERVNLYLGDDASIDPVSASIRNCLFVGGSLDFEFWAGGSVVLRDDLFDGVALTQGVEVDHDYNGYTAATNALAGNSTHNVTNTVAFQTGPLGNFYQPANSAFINVGSVTNAGLAGLYHYTTTTNQLRETNSVLDIGFHYLPVTNGVPFDTDGDGIPDYADADPDGDGLPDAWEMQNGLNPLLNDASDDPDGDWLTNLQEYNGGTNSTNPRDVMVIAWGLNTSGQCNVPAGLREIVAVAGGLDFSLALRNSGSLVTWGANAHGQTNVPAGSSNVTAIAAGPYHSFALRADGSVLSWGTWWSDSTNYPAATVPSGLSNVVGIAAGADHDLAPKADGTLLAWGDNTNEIHATVPAGFSGVQAVAAGWYHNAALRTNGTVVAWGSNNTWNQTNVPASLSNVTALAAGALHTLALKNNGTVIAWGAGDSTDPFPFAYGQSMVPTGLSNVVAIAAGGYHSMALRSDGSIVTWGDLAPPPVGQAGASAIGPGGTHGLAIRNGRLTPLIVQQPTNQIAAPGENVTFSAQGLGLAGVRYQWQFQGVNLSGATNATLTLTNVQYANETNYTVVISTGAGSITSSVATLTLVRAPQIVSTTPTAPSTNWFTNTFQLSVGATALATNSYPLSYQWLKDGVAIAGATNSSLSITSQWTPLWQTNAVNGNYTVKVSNVAGTNQSAAWTLRFLSIPKLGLVVAWGANDDGECEYPGDLTNAISIAAGEYHSVAARESGSVVQWGYNWGAVPASLTNAVMVAAGQWHTLALRTNGTVVSWGDTNAAANFVPTNLTGVKAVAAAWNHNVALLTNGTVTAWGYNGAELGWHLTEVPAGLSNVTEIAAGGLHSLALRSNGTVVAWGYSPNGETNVPSGLSNVVAIAAGGEHSLALKVDGTVTAWGYNGSGQCTVPTGLSNVMAVAAGWAHSVALKNGGTVVAWGSNTDGQTNVVTNLPPVKLIAAGGNHALAAVFSPLVSYSVDVTKDLLLIYNTNSLDSSNVWSYYMQHRPMVSGANVLSIGGATNDIYLPDEFTTNFAPSVGNWLAQNPTKRPQYVVLFPGIPERVNTNNVTGSLEGARASVSYTLHTNFAGWRPFVMHINMGDTNACKAYINKLEFIGTNYSPGRLLISARAGGYGNTNYYYDDSAPYGQTVPDLGEGVRTAVLSVDPVASVIYTNADDTAPNLAVHLTNGVNVAAYYSRGQHSALGNSYAVNGFVRWSGNSGWWIIATIESFNGQRYQTGQGNFIQWFSSTAFGGTNYANTPVGAVTHVEEPYTILNWPDQYMGLWAGGKNFAICAWGSLKPGAMYFQEVGDPFVTK